MPKRKGAAQVSTSTKRRKIKDKQASERELQMSEEELDDEMYSTISARGYSDLGYPLPKPLILEQLQDMYPDLPEEEIRQKRRQSWTDLNRQVFKLALASNYRKLRLKAANYLVTAEKACEDKEVFRTLTYRLASADFLDRICAWLELVMLKPADYDVTGLAVNVIPRLRDDAFYIDLQQGVNLEPAILPDIYLYPQAPKRDEEIVDICDSFNRFLGQLVQQDLYTIEEIQLMLREKIMATRAQMLIRMVLKMMEAGIIKPENRADVISWFRVMTCKRARRQFATEWGVDA